jgi:hypothetical protein
MELKVFKELQVRLDLLELLDQQVQQVHREFKVQLDQMELRERQV